MGTEVTRAESNEGGPPENDRTSSGKEYNPEQPIQYETEEEQNEIQSRLDDENTLEKDLVDVPIHMETDDMAFIGEEAGGRQR